MPTDLILKKENYEQEIAELTLMDDGLSRVAINKLCLQEILSILRNEPNLNLIKFSHQETLENFAGRSACADFYGVDAFNRHLLLELQNDNQGANLTRARFLGSMVDVRISEKGDEWKDMQEISVHFITQNDVIGKEQGVYHIGPVIQEVNEYANMKINYILAYIQGNDNPKIRQLMKDLNEKDPEKIVNPILKERVEYYKKGQGKKIMCRVMREIEERSKEEGRAEGRAEGKTEAIIEMVKNLMSINHLTAEVAMKMLGIPAESQKTYLPYLTNI